MRIRVDPEVRKRFLKLNCRDLATCFQSDYFYVSQDNVIGLCKKFERRRYTEFGTFKFKVPVKRWNIQILKNLFVHGNHLVRAMRVFRRRRIVTLGIYHFRKGTVLVIREGDQYILIAPFSPCSPPRWVKIRRLSELVKEVPESYNVMDVMSRLDNKSED